MFLLSMDDSSGRPGGPQSNAHDCTYANEDSDIDEGDGYIFVCDLGFRI